MKTISIAIAIIGSLTFYVGILHLIYFFASKRNKSNFWFSFVCFAVTLYDISCFYFYISEEPITAIWFQRAQFVSIAFMSLSILVFVHSLTRRKMRIFSIILFITYLIFMIIPWIEHPLLLDITRPAVKHITFLSQTITYFESEPGILLIIEFISVIIGIFTAVILLISHFIKTKNFQILLILFGFAIFATFATIDIFTAAGKIKFFYLSEYAFFSIIIIMDYSLIKSLLLAFQKDHLLNSTLSSEITQRTSEISKLHRKLKRINTDLKKKNDMLKDLSEKDGLTGLINHVTFQKRVTQMSNMAERHSFPISMIMIDVDDFKEINDEFGHQVGDQVLITISKIFLANLRDYDIKSRGAFKEKSVLTLRNYDTAARYGGDEFSILLPFCTKEGAETVMERIYAKLKDVRVPGVPHQISISSGICYADKIIRIDDKKLIHHADTALYKSKKLGKNQYYSLSFKEAELKSNFH